MCKIMYFKIVLLECPTNIIGILLTISSVFITELQIKVDLVVEQCRQFIELFLRAKCSSGNIRV